MNLDCLRSAVSGLVDLLLPLRCAGCGVSGSGWCLACAKELGGLRRLDRPLLRSAPPTFALGYYSGAARRAVLDYKEAGRRDLAAPFGAALAVGIRGACARSGAWYLVPAPSRDMASRRRGGPHMVRVAKHAATALLDRGWRVSVSDCLAMARGVRDSVGLRPDERVHNLSGRLSLRQDRAPPTGASAILLDDVVTTGATLVSCTRVLDGAAIKVVAALSLTATA